MIKTLSLIAMLLANCSCLADERERSKRPDFRIVGYLPDYRKFDPSAASRLSDLIVFSAEPSPEGELDLKRLKNVPWQQLLKAKQQHGLRLILCVGGWERSSQFANVASSVQLRGKFVSSALQCCQEKQLDGIDLDWEHPQTASQQTNYAELLHELHIAFQPHGLHVSVTMAAWQVVPQLAFESVDWIQVMAYDHPGRHSTLDGAQADIKKLMSAGAPANKITLGLPFYGRSLAGASRTLTYEEILNKYHPAPDVDEVDGIYFNGPATTKRKVQFAQQTGLAGVMVWEVGQDARGERSLLKSINDVLLK